MTNTFVTTKFTEQMNISAIVTPVCDNSMQLGSISCAQNSDDSSVWENIIDTCINTIVINYRHLKNYISLSLPILYFRHSTLGSTS